MNINEKEVDAPSSSSENPARRKLIQSLFAGGAVVTSVELMPASWTRPIIGSAVLPAHAETTMSAAAMMSYTVTLENTTMSQALTPAAIVVHGGSYMPPMIGDMASPGLKDIAEFGNIDRYTVEAEMAGGMVTKLGTDPVGPGMMGSAMIMAAAGSMVTVVSMYEHTNDTIAVATLDLMDGATVDGVDLDAGTEENDPGQNDATQGPAGKDVGTDTDPQAAIAAGTVDNIDGVMRITIAAA